MRQLKELEDKLSKYSGRSTEFLIMPYFGTHFFLDKRLSEHQ